ncbi:hypothetical protein DFQ26_003959 [Actinomortierella ambigua]|nr:hypothetical protein DFQ26_003959 [Actinomortierella ambigua]
MPGSISSTKRPSLSEATADMAAVLPTRPLTKFEQFSVRFHPLMLYVVSLAQFLDIVNGAAMTVAMVPIAQQLHFRQSQMQWIISAYALAFGGLLLLAGRTGDIYGHKRVFLLGLSWFALWSLVNGFGSSPVMFCISRALQGAGAAFTIPTALALISTNYPAGPARTRALAVWGAFGGMGAVTGLLLSGALTSTIGWEYLFRITAIVSLLLVGVGVFAIPFTIEKEEKTGQRKLDVGGAFLVTAGVICVIYYITSAEVEGWGSPRSLPVLAVGVLMLAGFLWLESRLSYAIMPFHIWKHRAFSSAVIVTFVMQAQFQGFLYYSTLIFQKVLGYDIMKTALSYLVHGLTAIVAYSLMGKYLPRLSLKPFMLMGFFLIGLSSLLFAFVTPTTNYWTLPFIGLIVNVIGLGFTMMPGQIAALGDAANEDQGVVGSIYNLALQIGSPFGLALLTVISQTVTGSETGKTPEQLMNGYQKALFGDTGLAVLGFLLTLVLLPNIRPKTAAVDLLVEETDLEAGGKEAIDEKNQSTSTLEDPMAAKTATTTIIGGDKTEFGEEKRTSPPMVYEYTLRRTKSGQSDRSHPHASAQGGDKQEIQAEQGGDKEEIVVVEQLHPIDPTQQAMAMTNAATRFV